MIDEVAFRWERMTTGINSPKPQNLVSIYEFFQYRRTSHVEDEPICLAILAGLDPSLIKKIASISDTTETANQRMKQFLSLHEQMPLFLLFTGNSHFEEDGIRWAPRSFTHHEPDTLSGPATFPTTAIYLTGANIRRSGLYFSCSGFLIKTSADESYSRIFRISVSKT